jgi:myo-inositol-1(or 4)-monophosphatase
MQHEEHMQEFRTVAVAAAQQAGKIIAEAYRTDFQVYYKQETLTNLVTEVDRQSEAAIVELLSSAFPDHHILAEEGGEALRNPSAYRWYVDPLDGTTNFAHGFPMFCVSIGLEAEGRMVLGVVYDPLRRELFEAQAGQGAFLNGERIHVSKVTDLKKALLVTGFPYDHIGRTENLPYFSRFALESQGVRRTGSAAIDLSYVAAGRIDGFWESGLKPWDIAAGSVLVVEAGGSITDFLGNPFSVHGTQTLASNGLIHQAMRDVITGK